MYTAEQITQFQRCANDPYYFISNYLINFGSGSTADGIFRHFRLYPHHIVLSQLRDTDNLFAAYVIWYVMFNNDKTVAIAAPTEIIAKDFIVNVYRMIDNLPSWIKLKYEEQTKRGCRFSNNSRIIIGSTSVYGFRGVSLSLLLWINADQGKRDTNQEFLQTVYPSISKNAQIILTDYYKNVAFDGFLYKLYIGATTVGSGSVFNSLLIG